MTGDAREGDEALFARLDSAWAERGPGALPVFDTRSPGDTWIRFHSLPAKRYAESDGERAEVLRRHHAVLTDLIQGATDVVVVCADWDESDAAHDWHQRYLPNARRWKQVQTDPDGSVSTLWADTTEGLDALDPLLLAVADDLTGPVVITTSSPEWLYHPYDGGADVIARTPTERDALAARYSDWRSPLGSGL